jgi:hypothetical protein
MAYARSILPKTTWSLWVRLEQALKKMEAPKANLWKMLEAKLLVHNSTGEGIHARIRAELGARGQRAALAVEGEEE